MSDQGTLFEMELVSKTGQKVRAKVHAKDFAKEADALWCLLTSYVQFCDLIEKHYQKIINKQYRDLADEKNMYKAVTEKYFIPLINKCAWEGYVLEDLRYIIPPAFKTNVVQRHDILKDLRIFYKKEFGEYVLPV